MREQEIVKAVQRLKDSEHQTTAIKVEFEAQFNRGQSRNINTCDECDEGSNTCGECDGDWEDNHDCEECDGSGSFQSAEWLAWNESPEETRGMEPEEHEECDYCCGGGRLSCGNCEEGYVECYECNGNWRGEGTQDSEAGGEDWGNVVDCHIFIMKRLKELGLAEYKANQPMIRLAHGINTRWHPKAPLTYAEFYRDGSVDSEFTTTLMLDDPQNIFLLPKIEKIFIDLGRKIGNGIDVDGAGMHMALLQDPDGLYPNDYRDDTRYRNFRQSMLMLLPALYFLGTSTDRSRRMQYRTPNIDQGSHRAAIDFRSGAIEFRIFDTCYDTPDAILDNVVVMSKAMKFWSRRRHMPSVARKHPMIRFGNNEGDKLERLYATSEHLDVLNEGLKVLKPDYYTVKELKKQRKFNTSKRSLHKLALNKRKDLELTYQEYAERFDRSLFIDYHYQFSSHIDSLTNQTVGTLDASRIIAEATRLAEIWQNDRKTRRQPAEVYVTEHIRQWETNIAGEYTLQVEV